MPPTFAIAMCLVLFLCGAAAVWSVALLLAIAPGKRHLAKRIALGMAGTIPGMLLFQVLAAPPLAACLAAGGWVLYHIPQRGVFYEVLFFGVIASVLGGALLASTTGFVVGWSIGWNWAAGRLLGDCIRSNRVLGPLVRFAQRRLPFTARVLP